jgi:serine/threonine protein phosphatase PrpC
LAFADPDQAAARLVRLANRNWGDDNTAVVVAEQSGGAAATINLT